MERTCLLMLIAALATGAVWAAPASRTFRNDEYGFQVALPRAAAASEPAAPSPAHGIALRLASGGEIRVSGEFDAAFLGSADAAAGQLIKDEAYADPARVDKVRTSGPSARCFQRSVEGRIQRRCLVFRPRGDAVAIVYTLALDSSESSARADRQAFDRLVRSFALTPLPR